MTDFPQKLIISLEPICVIVTKKMITISPKLATLSSGQIFDDTQIHTHTHTDTQTQGLPIYMEDFILPCNEPEMYKVDWRVISDADKELYSLNSEALLRNVCIPTEALSCKNTSCSNVQHRTDLNVFYAQLVGCLSEASRQLSRKCKRYVSQPGWNEHVADLHKTARDAFVMWANCGKPRQGSKFDLMRQSRACFKYALRAVKTHESSLRKQSLANKLSLSQPNQFWNEIRSMGGKNLSLPSCIEGVTRNRNVCNVWKNHF